MAKVILENVQVLAAGQKIDQDVNVRPQNVQAVTLLVSPEDNEKLALAGVEAGEAPAQIRVLVMVPPVVRPMDSSSAPSGPAFPKPFLDKEKFDGPVGETPAKR